MKELKSKRRRPGAGGKLARTDQFTFRLDPKTRYTAELAANQERRTLSSFLEWALDKIAKEIPVYFGTDGTPLTVADVVEVTWDIDPVDRFVKLASQFPGLLTSQEHRKWKFIQEHDIFWIPDLGSSRVRKPTSKFLIHRKPNFPVIRAGWPQIEAYAEAGDPFEWSDFLSALEEANIDTFNWQEGGTK